jgi:hypothetical protein
MYGIEQTPPGPLDTVDSLAKAPAQTWERPQLKKALHMLYTIAVVLLILWLLGMVSAYTIGGFIHVLLVIAIVMVLLRLISGRKVL